MRETSLLPVRLFFDAVLTPESHATSGESLYIYGGKDSGGGLGCAIQSKTPMLPSYIPIIIASLGAMDDHNVTRFNVDDFLRLMRVKPDSSRRRDVAKVIDACVEWFFECRCLALEYNHKHNPTRYEFRVLTSKSVREPGTYDYEFRWSDEFLGYLRDAYAKMVIPSHLGAVDGLKPTMLDNALVYTVERRATDKSKVKNNDVFRLATYLGKWGIRSQKDNPAHFARDVKSIDTKLRSHYKNVKWRLGKKEVSVSDVNAKTWEDASVVVSGRKWL